MSVSSGGDASEPTSAAGQAVAAGRPARSLQSPLLPAPGCDQAATPTRVAAEDSLASELFTPDSEFADERMSIEEQCEYQQFLQNMLAASRPLSASKVQASPPHSSVTDVAAGLDTPTCDGSGRGVGRDCVSNDGVPDTPSSSLGRSSTLASPLNSVAGSSTAEGWEEELLDHVDVLGRQKELVERENGKLRRRLEWSERTVQSLRAERNEALSQLQESQRQEVVPQTPSDVEMQLIRAKMELAQNYEDGERLAREKKALERVLAERRVELDQAQAAKADAEQNSLHLARKLAEVKTRLAQEQAAREDAEVTLDHAVHAKLEAQAQLEEYRHLEHERNLQAARASSGRR